MELPVKEGSEVEEGQVIARLDPTDFQIAVNDRQATFNRARADHERAAELVKEGHISRMDHDRLQDYALELKKELVLVDGVRKVEIGGLQPEIVYVEISRARMGELGISMENIGTIRRACEEVPEHMVYFDGQPALTIGISMLEGENVVAVGGRLEALLIVVVVLLVFMGLKTGLIIGAVLLITVAGTLFIMELWGIELQRVSLGALVIALGMLVDNAIVVAEGMLVRMRGGMDASDAARETVGKTNGALIGGTVIGILAFSAIGLSPNNTGEFARSLFYVILISLSLSWLTAVSTVPLLMALMIKPGRGGEQGDPYGGAIFRAYRRATVLTLIVVPVLYAILFRIPYEEGEQARPHSAPQTA